MSSVVIFWSFERRNGRVGASFAAIGAESPIRQAEKGF
jgi:hypothetical protein